ncbi:MAG: hypothetical protein ABIJ56_03475 [Pseudomonadota bacterium]
MKSTHPCKRPIPALVPVLAAAALCFPSWSCTSGGMTGNKTCLEDCSWGSCEEHPEE